MVIQNIHTYQTTSPPSSSSSQTNTDARAYTNKTNNNNKIPINKHIKSRSQQKPNYTYPPSTTPMSFPFFSRLLPQKRKLNTIPGTNEISHPKVSSQIKNNTFSGHFLPFTPDTSLKKQKKLCIETAKKLNKNSSISAQEVSVHTRTDESASLSRFSTKKIYIPYHHFCRNRANSIL